MSLLHCRFGLMAAALLLAYVTPLRAEPDDYLDKSDDWFAGAAAKEIAANILSWQSEAGGWPKNEETTDKPYTGERRKLEPTYDNGATTDELRFLARIHNATQDDVYRSAFERGLDYVFAGQYANGGWPQFHPPGDEYHRHITFNDNAMVRLLEFVREVAGDETYAFVDDSRRAAARDAFDRGIGCILKCQIEVDGELTGWCAQHDAVDFTPQSARTYELATLSGAESVGITRLLMSLDDPSPQVIAAVEGAVRWLETAKLTGLRVIEITDEAAPKGKDRLVVDDPDAPPIWARFYDLDTNHPVFCDRDGVPKPRLWDIGYERRNGYAWYGTWPQKLLEKEYPRWKARIDAQQP